MWRNNSTILGVHIYNLGVHKLRIHDNEHDLTPEISKTLSYTGCSGKSMKNENDISMMNKIINDFRYTGDGDRESKRKTFFTKVLPKLVEKIQNKTFDEITDGSDDLQ